MQAFDTSTAERCNGSHNWYNLAAKYSVTSCCLSNPVLFLLFRLGAATAIILIIPLLLIMRYLCVLSLALAVRAFSVFSKGYVAPQ